MCWTRWCEDFYTELLDRMSATDASQSLKQCFLFVFNVANNTPVGHNQDLKLARIKVSECVTLGNKIKYL